MTPTVFHDQAFAWIGSISAVILYLITIGAGIWAALQSARHSQQIEENTARLNGQSDQIGKLRDDAMPPAAVAALLAPSVALPMQGATLGVTAPPAPVPAPVVTIQAPPAPAMDVNISRKLNADELAAAHAAINAANQAASDPALVHPDAPAPLPSAPSTSPAAALLDATATAPVPATVIIAQPPTEAL